MSKNAGPDNLDKEIAAMPAALREARKPDEVQAVILARLVNGMSCESWLNACKTHMLGGWHAFPVSTESAKMESYEDDLSSKYETLAVSPFREVPGALTGAMFGSLLKRELLRVGRNGGCLSLVSAGIADRRKMLAELGDEAVTHLEDIMGSVLLARMEACDSLGILRRGQYICSLPGLGQLAARNFAEKAQSAFMEAAASFLPQDPECQPAGCAMGIVNVLQGDAGNVRDLLKRSKTVLEVAMEKQDGHIHQESSMTPLENTTLVQSSEKRFLFFGGDPS